MLAQALIRRVNGRDCEQLSVFDRGFQFGDGIFETARFYRDRCPLWPLHMSRLIAGCGRLGLDCPTDEIEAEYHTLCQRLQAAGQVEAIIKMQLSRGESLRGYGTVEARPTLVALAFIAAPFESLLPARRVAISSVRLGRQPLLAGLKHSNRLEQVLAKQQLGAGYDDAIMLDSEGYVVEAISSNVLFKYQGQWLTPKLTHCGVAGVVRDLLLQRGLLQLADQPVNLALLAQAEAICLSNTVQGVQAVKALDVGAGKAQGRYQWPDADEQVQPLRQIYCSAFVGD